MHKSMHQHKKNRLDQGLKPSSVNRELAVIKNLLNFSRYAGDNIADEGTVPIWITNDGLEAKDTSITFEELAKLLGEIGDLADRLSNPT